MFNVCLPGPVGTFDFLVENDGGMNYKPRKSSNIHQTNFWYPRKMATYKTCILETMFIIFP